MRAYEDPNSDGNSSKYHTGELCVEGCGRPAGTHWSPHWCWQCNAQRMQRITQSLEDIQGRFNTPTKGRNDE